MEFIGKIIAPPVLYGLSGGDVGTGIGNFLSLMFRLAIVGGGVYALFKIILAGYAFLSAGDDPKSIESAWARIWQSLIGLSLIVGAFVLAAIFGRIFFGSYTAIISPSIPTIEDVNTNTVQPNPGLPALQP